MSIKPVLPPIQNPDNTLPGINRPGHWIKGPDVGILDSLAGALIRPQHNLEAEDLSSIPDVWAQVELAKAALLERRHPLHQLTRNRWRGLLALLALSRIQNLEIEIRLVALPDLEGEPFISSIPTPGNFASVLMEIMPHEKIDAHSSWEIIGLILHEDLPIGLIVPSILVCPFGGNEQHLGYISWARNGDLGDPCQCGKLPPIQIKAIESYIRNINENLNNLPDIEHRYPLVPLRRELDHFLNELLVCRHGLPDPTAGIDLKQEAFPLPPYDIYTSLNQIPHIDNGHRVTDLMLRLRPGFDQDLGAILLDSNLASEAEASQIVFWNNYTLSQAWILGREREEESRRIQKEAKEQGVATILAAHFFTNHLYEIEDGRFCAHPAGFEKFFLPLNSRALFFFSPDDLNDRLNITQYADQCEVSLHMELVSSDGTRRPYTAVRKYDRQKGEVVKIERPATLSAWPDFQSEMWENYFLLHSGTEGVTPGLGSVFSLGLAMDRLAGCASKEQKVDVFVNRALDLYGEKGCLRMYLETTQTRRDLVWLDRPPEAIVMYSRHAGEGRDMETAGLVLFPAFEFTNQEDENWTIGVDFGTTSTAVYYKKGAGPAKPLVFQNRYLTPFGEHTEMSIGELNNELIPCREASPPFLSMLMSRGGGDKLKKPILAAYTYYVIRAINSVRELAAGLGSGDGTEGYRTTVDLERGRLDHSLKWSEQKENRAKVKLFLGQTALQSLAEAVRSGADPAGIDWRYSYPTAFLPDHLVWYKETFGKAVQMVLGPLGREHKIKQPGVETRTESLCSGLFFQDADPAIFTGTVITIDVGGKTSDVSIWQNRKLVWQNSLLFGGKDLFIYHFVRDVQKGSPALNLLLPGDYMDTIADLRRIKNEEGALEAALEILLADAGVNRDIRQQLSEVISEPHVRAFEIMVRITLSGMLYYLGMVLFHLVDEGLMEPDDSPVHFLFAGRGCQVFENLKINLDHMSQFLGKANDHFPGKPKFQFSRSFKHEVAHGLVVDPPGFRKLDENHHSQASVCGEQILVGDLLKKETQAFRLEDLKDEWQIKDLPVIRDFVKKFRRAEGFSRLDFIDEVVTRLNMQMRDECLEWRAEIISEEDDTDVGGKSAKNKDIPVQPVFILGLKEYIRLALENGFFDQLAREGEAVMPDGSGGGNGGAR